MKDTVFNLVKQELVKPENYNTPQPEKVEQLINFIEQQEAEDEARVRLLVDLLCVNGSCELPALAKSAPFDTMTPQLEIKLETLRKLA